MHANLGYAFALAELDYRRDQLTTSFRRTSRVTRPHRIRGLLDALRRGPASGRRGRTPPTLPPMPSPHHLTSVG